MYHEHTLTRTQHFRWRWTCSKIGVDVCCCFFHECRLIVDGFSGSVPHAFVLCIMYILCHGICMKRKLKSKENRNCYALRVRDNFSAAFHNNCERRKKYKNHNNNSHDHVLKFAHRIHRCQHRLFFFAAFLVRENEWLNGVVTAASHFTFRCEYFNGKYSFLSILFVVSVY